MGHPHLIGIRKQEGIAHIHVRRVLHDGTELAADIADGLRNLHHQGIDFIRKRQGFYSSLRHNHPLNFITNRAAGQPPNEKNKPTNVKFKYNGTEYKSLSELNDIIKGDISVSKNQIRLIYIDWSWPYETGTGTVMTNADKTDTQEGLNPLDYTFDIVVKGTQVRI